ncbi:hypothetical protein EMIHUDRAFT_244280 [Emiliania huxleyi CCMP1516]|uniref:Uncharacterized protein n=2 Tax=Emiliania huxleyi TaxID=2903 RepID=A0A0D3J135_EMIH1|nr:hypothetical protein EMIHUDRAFT_244280 [Emiliania huxleyi CCMP1516]EOD17220.1 hypothetical protein EMIHUDRAFT_244280 [Emiliania huxleyi CCMP1516]|eukprot:XP_005769649.1 hypothetical protein EMIHUDRAFT_244280 [Emiliania huxleyi CCMP1516]
MLLLALSLPAGRPARTRTAVARLGRPARTRTAVARLAGEAFIASPIPAAPATAYGQELGDGPMVADGGARAKPAPFTQMELAALQGVSLSARKPAEYLLSWRESGVAPLGLLDVFGRPTTFASLLRNPQADPDGDVWDAVRNDYPVLKEKGDDELAAALQPIKAVYVDLRYI